MKIDQQLDVALSRLVRLRDCRGGVGYCISCGRPITYQTSQCGHYVPRQHRATRWDERNCNAQCVDCNCRLNGNIPGYTVGLMHKYGDEVIDELIRAGRSIAKFSHAEKVELLKQIRAKIRELEQWRQEVG